MRRTNAGRRRLDNTRWDQSRNPFEMDHENFTFTTIDLEPLFSVPDTYEPPMGDSIIFDTQPFDLEHLTSDSAISSALSSRFNAAMDISESSGTSRNPETISNASPAMFLENPNAVEVEAINYRRNRLRNRERNLCSRCERAVEPRDGNFARNEINTNRNECVKCLEDTGDFHYRDANGRLCQRCCPARRNCKNREKGCTYEEINLKMWKHETYFCFFLERCIICKVDIPTGTILQHYFSHQSPKSVKIGQKFRIQNRGPMELAPHADFIILAEFGPAVCTFFLRDGLFRIGIHAPLPTTELHKYKCMIQISDSVCKRKRRYYLCESYTDSQDWHLVCHINEIDIRGPWTGKADIKVIFTKIAQ